ncbi:MAG TPA: SUMF1/EgtB/PvdO family nonheme iron enzyme [Polyangiaceae bacterium]
MASIPEGTFSMGSDEGQPDEKPVHQVHVASFDLDVTEVTVAEYARCVTEGTCAPAALQVLWPGVTEAEHKLEDELCNGDRPDHQDHPVNCVDWSMASTYCAWSGKRLPTEEEWEYAAKGPNARRFPWGDAAPSSDVLNGCGDECVDAMRARGKSVQGLYRGSDKWPFTAPVARFAPGSFGLYDMAGNVWEWTASRYCPYDASSCTDPRRVVRGGSWQVVDWNFVRTVDREPYDPTTRNPQVGFRCAR